MGFEVLQLTWLMSLVPVTGGPRGSVAGAEVGAPVGAGVGALAGAGAGAGADATVSGAATAPLVMVRWPIVMDLPPVGATAGAAEPNVNTLLPIR